MPLPSNGSLSLQGHSRPGEGITAKPKQAMIVRMSEETLDALQTLTSEERMDFEFGNKPGIWIRDVFFPMQAHRENSPHELFIRTTSSIRPNGPLKLNANVVGRFVVERDLTEKFTKKIHESSVAAAKQKTDRTVVMLDAPPVGTASKKRSKTAPKLSASTSRNILIQRVPSPLPPPPSRVASPSLSLPKEGLTPIRARLIHFLALGQQPTKEVIKVIGGATADNAVQMKIREVLAETAEQDATARKAYQASSSTEDPRPWRLKPKTWLDVRPHQYADYTDSERLSVARTARVWLSNLKIPESDPAWDHVKFKASGSASKPVPAANTTTTASTMGGMKTSDFKGVLPSKDGKEKKVKGKGKAAASVDVKAKSEAVQARVEGSNHPRVSAAADNDRGQDKEEGEISPPPPRKVVGRKLPGSKPPAIPQLQVTPRPTPPGSSTAVQKKRTGPVDVRGVKKELPAPSGSAKPAPPLPPPVPSEKKASPMVKAPKKEKVMATSTAPIKKDVERGREREKASTGVKRKQPSYEDDDSDSLDSKSSGPRVEQKRKKVSEIPGATSTRYPKDGESKARDNSMQAKKKMTRREESPPPRTKMKKEVSPLPPAKALSGPSNPAAPPRHTSGSISSTKTRRRSPIYTSSDENEDDLRHPVTAKATNGHTLPSRPRSSLPLPTDHAGLRARYSVTYGEYIDAFQKVVTQRSKNQRLLNKNGTSGSGGMTDSEGDVDMMESDELVTLKADYQRLFVELESIRQAFDH